MEETGYTIIDWLSAGLAVCTIVISFMTYLYFKARLKIKSLKEDNDRLMWCSKIMAAYLSVASNNEEIVKVLRPDRILDIDMGKVRELSSMHHI